MYQFSNPVHYLVLITMSVPLISFASFTHPPPTPPLATTNLQPDHPESAQSHLSLLN